MLLLVVVLNGMRNKEILISHVVFQTNLSYLLKYLVIHHNYPTQLGVQLSSFTQ